MSDQNNFDVVVVGAGNAAMSAAITAKQDGARVLVLEGAPKDMRGGNTHFTDGFHYNYPGSAGLMRGAVFGKRAGAHAAKFVQS